MNINIKTAKDFLGWVAGLGDYDSWASATRDKYKALFKNLPPQERYLVQRGKIEDYFTEESRAERPPKEYKSPSGRYTLRVSSYGTKPGSWDYTRGEVFAADGQKVADVKRNYSSFPFLFMEDHVDGHDYLVCGEDYQGQTFCQLDTGAVKPLIPDDAFEGFGFCWASYELMSDGRTLLVNGCYWACPYEFRLYDVSDPMNGWPLLEVEKEGEKNYHASFDDYKAKLVLDEEGRFVWTQGEWVNKKTGESESAMESRHSAAYRAYHVAKEKGEGEVSDEELEKLHSAYNEMVEGDPDPEEDPDKFDKVVHERIILARKEGNPNVLTIVEHWKSEERYKVEKEGEEREAERKAERKKWWDDSELKAVLSEVVESFDGLVGYMYPSYNARHVEGDTNPCYLTLRGRPFDPDKSYNHSASLQWGVEARPICLELWIRGKGYTKAEFPRTREGILDAWAAGQTHLAAEVRG